MIFQQPNYTNSTMKVDTTYLNCPITPDNATNDYLAYSAHGVSLILDVHDFTANEITCKVSKLLLEVVAESNRPGRCGFFRKYVMPQNVAPQNCICQVNNEGLMYIAVPWEGCTFG